jgi:hypothetical protein
MKTLLLLLSFFFVQFLSQVAQAKEVTTNEVSMPNAPDWVTETRVNGIVEKIQTLLQWDIRRIHVTFYSDEAAFENVHHMGPTVLAFSRKSDNSVHVGPRVTSENFEGVFGHELTHVISFQKYHDAIPSWLEEGLANYLVKRGDPDYAWMATQPPLRDIHELTHPFNGTTDHVRFVYMASRALIDMIAAKCDLNDLLQLSVGKKMETYFGTYCGIPDLNAEFRKWIASKKNHS